MSMCFCTGECRKPGGRCPVAMADLFREIGDFPGIDTGIFTTPYRDDTPKMDPLPETVPVGWECPVCGRGVAPTESECNHDKDVRELERYDSQNHLWYDTLMKDLEIGDRFRFYDSDIEYIVDSRPYMISGTWAVVCHEAGT